MKRGSNVLKTDPHTPYKCYFKDFMEWKIFYCRSFFGVESEGLQLDRTVYSNMYSLRHSVEGHTMQVVCLFLY